MPATFIFFILIASFSTHGVAEADPCFTRCRKGEPWVHFPFRLMDRQSLNCGYPDPALVLYCNDRNETTLHLPSAVSLRVKKIEYVTQQLLLYDPQACLPETLQQLNLSPSSFRFLDGLYTNDFVLFNCSKGNRGDGSQSLVKSCSRYPRDEIYAVSVDSYMDSLSLISCTSMHTISSVPVSIFDKNDISLTWSTPACGSFCKAQGKICMAPPPGDATMEFQCVKVHKGNKKGRLISGLVVGCMFLVILIGAVIFLIISFIKDRENRKKIEGFLEDYKALKPTRFSYADIRRITNQFSEKLGEGGYGVVYKGRLSAEISVAVKVLNNSKENGEEFVNEVSTMGRIHHVNVVRLVGFCAEGFRRVLVYEFLPNESLEKFIFQAESKRSSLGWEKLYNIALGIAKGIEYLHQGCDQQILHFDIKPHNILLDHNFSPKISDFGLAKLCSKEQSAVTMTAARGTMGYIAPELLSRTFGRVSYKSDVYSFGMLLLEMVGGRKNVDKEADKNSQVYFPQWIYSHLNLGDDIWEHIEENRQQLEGEGESENQIKDSPMADCGRNIVRKLTIVGLHCIQWYPADRPSMSAVVVMLEGDGSDLTMPPNPFPNTNATYLVAAIPQTPFQIDLPLILEE